MTRRRKVLAVVLALPLAAVAGAMLALSHDATCPDAAPAAETAHTMLAVTARCYGSSTILRVDTVARPDPADDEVLVRVHVASVNPVDWHYMLGKPYVMRLSSGVGRPDDTRVGTDFAGTVEAVGSNVTRFRVGDAVFGARQGAFAEYVVVRADRNVEPLPAGASFEDAAALTVAAITALQAVRDHGAVRAGQRVLVNGASGGVGTYAVQVAKAYGAHVTGVSSTRNVELVLSLGADRVIDYTQVNFTERDERFDVIIDMVGNHPLRHLRRVLTPDGVVVIVGGPKDNPWIGPMSRALLAAAYSPLVSQRFGMFISELRREDLRQLRELMEAGQLRSVIDRRFTLAEVPAAMDYLEQGRSRGKNIIVISGDPAALAR